MKMAQARRSVIYLLCVFSVLLCSGTAVAQKTYAQEPPLDKSDPSAFVAAEHPCPCICQQCNRRWQLIITPYGWATSMNGSLSVKNATADFDVSFGKLLDHLDYAAMGQVELTNGRWMLISDTFLAKISAGASVDKSLDVLFGQGNVYLNVDANVEETLLIQELLAGYRIYESEIQCADACGPARKMALDLLFGGRYFNIDAKVNAEAELQVEGPQGELKRVKKSASVSDTIDWTDAVVGARLKYDLTRNLALSLRGDAGGFEGKDDSSWSAAALAEWRIRKHLTLIGGYKYENFRYSPGAADMEITLKGPIAALTWKWDF
jgi:hypothetical protein